MYELTERSRAFQTLVKELLKAMNLPGADDSEKRRTWQPLPLDLKRPFIAT